MNPIPKVIITAASVQLESLTNTLAIPAPIITNPISDVFQLLTTFFWFR